MSMDAWICRQDADGDLRRGVSAFSSGLWVDACLYMGERTWAFVRMVYDLELCSGLFI